MSRISPITGGKITNIVGSWSERGTFKIRVKYEKLDLAPSLGDLLVVDGGALKWVARIEEEKQISFGDSEAQIQEVIVDEDLSAEEKNIYFAEEFIIRLVGVLEEKGINPVIRTYPNRSAIVRYPNKAELQQITALDSGKENVSYLGDYAVGDEVHKDVHVKLSVSRFLKRRSAILGQAGFGKSNLIKSLMAEIGYHSDDTAIIIFDIDGEYSFKTQQSPGLADIKNIKDRLVVFSRADRNEDYPDLIAGKPNLNLKDLLPQEVVENLFPSGKRGTNYAVWLMSIKRSELESKWHKLVDKISEKLFETDLDEILEVLGMHGNGSEMNSLRVSASGLRTVLSRLVFSHHDAESKLLSTIQEAVEDRRIVVMDLSRMPIDTAEGLVEIVLSKVFRNNETKFVNGEDTVPVLVMVEEAQNFLSQSALRSDEGNIVIRIAKEGRKFGFGLIYITQQPSSIDDTILSQTNNFFVLHLLTQGDIRALTDNNPTYKPVAHYIQSEPLRGYAYFYSNVYSEDGSIKPTTVIFGAKIRKYDDVVKEIDALQPKKAWESVNKQRVQENDDFMKIVIQVLTDFQQSNNLKPSWVQLWGDVNNRLPDNHPHKSKYKTGKGNLYPSKSAISIAEAKLSGQDKDMPFKLSKDETGKNYVIEQKS
ncbi:MAG: ATP-binding protein [Anaerolineae bacterium]|nr:ATP-binding protein [Anaerolineae bacterium]